MVREAGLCAWGKPALVICYWVFFWGGGDSVQVHLAFPIPFWRVSIAALSSPTPGDGRVTPG